LCGPFHTTDPKGAHLTAVIALAALLALAALAAGLAASHRVHRRYDRRRMALHRTRPAGPDPPDRPTATATTSQAGVRRRDSQIGDHMTTTHVAADRWTAFLRDRITDRSGFDRLPRHVLRELLDLHHEEDGHCAECDDYERRHEPPTYPCVTVRTLASAYYRHPDYPERPVASAL
jgi:hypothetical protein